MGTNGNVGKLRRGIGSCAGPGSTRVGMTVGITLCTAELVCGVSVGIQITRNEER
jgi:hypothetical protein